MSEAAGVYSFEAVSSSDEQILRGAVAARPDKEIMKASNEYAQEDRARSWFHVVTTLGALGASLALAAVGEHWMTRGAGSVVAGLLIVRTFILYHDFKHGSILRDSRLARVIMDAFGILCLTPHTVWTQTHNYHHAHTAKLVGSHVGSYMMVSTQMWEEVGPLERKLYGAKRHPLTILFGYYTVFMYGMCLSAFQRNPRKNLDSLAAVVVQIGLGVGIGYAWGFEMLMYTLLVPQMLSHALGAYLFYAQHNFPDAHIQPREEWTFVRAALESSSYMKLGPVMNYFTGNIGYHHVHHLNYRIPFYRLPEAMAGIPELQNPRGVTSLAPSDIAACFELKLWDANRGKLVGYDERR